MNNEARSIFKTLLADFVKVHNQYAGSIMEFANNLDEATQIAQSLPTNIQYQLKATIETILAARDFQAIFFGR